MYPRHSSAVMGRARGTAYGDASGLTTGSWVMRSEDWPTAAEPIEYATYNAKSLCLLLNGGGCDAGGSVAELSPAFEFAGSP
jgi:hypothetical protein